MNLKYDYDIDLSDRRNVHTQLIAFVPNDSHVLEVGCSTGFMSEVLRQRKGCRVTAVEIDAVAAQIARARCDCLVVGDIEAPETIHEVGGPFDVILLGDVLEHLRDPEEVLRRLVCLLKPKGCAVVSVPNIAHWRIRRDLLLGRFDYEERGILDHTHMRFFTLRTAYALLEKAGLRVRDVGYTSFRLPRGIVHLVPGLFATQFVFRAERIR